MPFVRLETLEEKEPTPGFAGRFIHSANMTVAHWTVNVGAPLPEHSHPHEQVVNVIEGEFELTINGDTTRLGLRSVAIVPSNAVHSGKALTKCRIINVFSPVREDYR